MTNAAGICAAGQRNCGLGTRPAFGWRVSFACGRRGGCPGWRLTSFEESETTSDPYSTVETVDTHFF